MIYQGEYITPLRSGLLPVMRRAVDELALAGGPARQIRRQVMPIVAVPAEYLLKDEAMLTWFRAWYRATALEGGAQFNARLSVSGEPLAIYTVQFAGPPVIVDFGYRGLLQATLEVLSGPITV